MGKKILNSQGMSLVEVIVGLGIVGIAMIGTLALQQGNQQVQEQNSVVNFALKQKSILQNLITDAEAWKRTIASTASNPTMACLKDRTDCSGVTGWQVLTLFDAGGNVYRSLPSNNGDGWGYNPESSQPCSTFRATGSRRCPVAYYMTWRPVCTDTPCILPAIRINIRFKYETGDEKQVNLDNAKYSILDFVRAGTGGNKTFTIVHAYSDLNGNGLPDEGGGPCGGPYGVVRRKMTIRDAALDNPYNLVTAAGTNNFRINEKGLYHCKGSAVGFAVNGFQASLNDSTGAVIAVGTGRAPRWLQGVANFQAFVPVFNAPATFSIRQLCEINPGGTPSADNYALGLPVATTSSHPTVYTAYTTSGGTFNGTTGGSDIYATLSCTKVN